MRGAIMNTFRNFFLQTICFPQENSDCNENILGTNYPVFGCSIFEKFRVHWPLAYVCVWSIWSTMTNVQWS